MQTPHFYPKVGLVMMHLSVLFEKLYCLALYCCCCCCCCCYHQHHHVFHPTSFAPSHLDEKQHYSYYCCCCCCCHNIQIGISYMPAQMNLEQLTYWYLKEAHNVNLLFLPKPHRFLFYRLRMNSIWPLEHPGHRPPLIPMENRMKKLQSYHQAIGFIQKCQKDESQSSDLRFREEERENCFWNVSELFFRFTNTFLLPSTWLHRIACF